MSASKLKQLESFCFKIGILIKDNRYKSNFGPYGQLLLNQIKNEWIKANLFKFENVYLIDSNITKFYSFYQKNAFLNCLNQAFDVKSLPIGLINTCDYGENNFKKTISSHEKIYKELFDFNEKFSINQFLSEHLTENWKTQLNSFFFYNNQLIKNSDSMSNTKNSVFSKSFKDPFTRIQREKKNWWIKVLNNPENLQIDHVDSGNINQSSINEFDLNYKLEEEKNDNKSISWLENIKHLKTLQENNEYLNYLFGDLHKNELIKQTKQLIITQTSAQNILKNIIIDSVQINPNNSNRFLFNLDFRLAPYKACIVSDNSTILTIAEDLRKTLFKHQINSFKMELKSESELTNIYEHLDEIGVPFAIYLPTTITKNGICLVRNRDTSLSEQAHIDRIANHFSTISNALTY